MDRFRKHIGRLMLTVLATGLLMVGGVAVRANTEPPIAIVYNGNLYRWGGWPSAPTAVTSDGYNDLMDYHNGHVVIRRWSATYLTHLRNGAAFPIQDTPPADIWYHDLSTGARRRLTTQADFGPDYAGAILRSGPTFSPDGNDVAWLENTVGQGAQARLVLYSLASRTRTVIASRIDLGIQTDRFTLPTPQWGEGNIALLTHTFYSEQGSGTSIQMSMITFIPPDGSQDPLPIAVQEGPVGATSRLRDIVWGTSQGRAVLFANSDVVWLRVTPPDWSQRDLVVNVTLLPRTNHPVLVQNGSYMRLGTAAWPSSVAYDGTRWGMQPSVRLDENPMTMLNDGFIAVYAQRTGHHSTISVVRGGVMRSLEMPELVARRPYCPLVVSVAAPNVVWTDDVQPTDALARTCPNSLPSRVAALGSRLVELSGRSGPFVLRSQPGAGAELPGIRTGASLQVLRGPVCGPDGFTWWYVLYEEEGRFGWTVEDEGRIYWLDPQD